MMRNSRKIDAVVALARAAATSCDSVRAGLTTASLMALGCIAFEAVHHPRLGNTQRQPVFHFLLQADVELGRELLLFLCEIFSTWKLHLEGELPHQRLMFTTGAPEADVALSDEALAEIQLTEGKKNLFHDPFIHQGDVLAVGLLYRCKRRKHPHQRSHGS